MHTIKKEHLKPQYSYLQKGDYMPTIKKEHLKPQYSYLWDEICEIAGDGIIFDARENQEIVILVAAPIEELESKNHKSKEERELENRKVKERVLAIQQFSIYVNDTINEIENISNSTEDCSTQSMTLLAYSILNKLIETFYKRG